MVGQLTGLECGKGWIQTAQQRQAVVWYGVVWCGVDGVVAAV